MLLLEGGNQRGAQIMHRHCSSGISLHVLLPYSVNVIEGFIEVNKPNMSWGLEDSVTCHFICVCTWVKTKCIPPKTAAPKTGRRGSSNI